MIRLKGKEKAQPYQDNHEYMMKKLEKGANLASSKAQQKNHISSKANTTKSKKHGKKVMLWLCIIWTWVGNVSTYELGRQTSWPTKRKVMDKALVSWARNWGILPRNAQCTKRQERKPKLQQEDAMDAMRWATRLIDVHTSKTSIQQTKATYAMLIEERGI